MQPIEGSPWIHTGVRVGCHRHDARQAQSLVLGYRFGEGMFVINTLGILENVGRHPAADRLMLNLVRYAAGTTEAPLAPKPDDLAEQLTAIGF